MATGDDDADRFRVPRWISETNSEDGELAERPPTTEDESLFARSQPYDGDDAEPYIPRAATPSLAAGEPLWPVPQPDRAAPLPPPVTKGQREAAEPQRRGLIIVAVAAAVVVIVAVALLVRGAVDHKTPAAGSGQAASGLPAGPAIGPSGPGSGPTGSGSGPGSGPASGSTGPATGPATGAPAPPAGQPSNAAP